MRRSERTAGFTLMEMLIVVAVIAILIAIAIPVFTSQLASASTATCDANQRSLKGTVSLEYMSNGNDEAAAAAAGVESMGLAASDLTQSGSVYSISAGSLCPDEGRYTITFSNGSIDVSCSVHGAVKLLGQDQTVMDKISSALMSVPDCDSAGSYEGSAGYTDTLLAALKDSGIDLESLGAVSWAWRPNSSYPKLYWSSVDISDPAMVGERVPLMSYNPSSGKYMAYTGLVGERKDSSGNVNGNVYKTQSPVSKQGQSYEDAYAEYLQLMEKYNNK